MYFGTELACFGFHGAIQATGELVGPVRSYGAYTLLRNGYLWVFVCLQLEELKLLSTVAMFGSV